VHVSDTDQNGPREMRNDAVGKEKLKQIEILLFVAVGIVK